MELLMAFTCMTLCPRSGHYVAERGTRQVLVHGEGGHSDSVCQGHLQRIKVVEIKQPYTTPTAVQGVWVSVAGHEMTRLRLAGVL